MPPHTLRPRAATHPPISLERRAAARARCLHEIVCESILPGQIETAPAILEDISSSGLRIALRRCFEPGCALAVTWRTADGTQRTLRAFVVRTTAEEQGNWVIGCSLTTPLTLEEVQAMA
jgi:hypothetical protein